MGKARKISRKKLAKKLAKQKRLKKEIRSQYSSAWCRPGTLVTFRPVRTTNRPNEWLFDRGIWFWNSLEDFKEWVTYGIRTERLFPTEELSGVYGVVVERCRPQGHWVLVKLITENFVGWVSKTDLVKAKLGSG